MSLKIPILFQNEDFVVISKPAGVVCNRATSVKVETLQDWMEENILSKEDFYEKSLMMDGYDVGQEFFSRSGLLHRLDKETSGVMVLAKNVETFAKIKKQFLDKITRKHYQALVHGKLEPKEGSIYLPLKRSTFNRQKFCAHPDGKMAITFYELEKVIHKQIDGKNEVFSLVNLRLGTGRTHQLRVHLSHIGFAIVSDPLYLGKRLEFDLKWCPRLFLHAFKLEFFDPKTEELLCFVSELPEDLTGGLE